jgi:hypothetical protein
MFLLKYFLLITFACGFIISRKADLAYGSERQIRQQLGHSNGVYTDAAKLENFLKTLSFNMRDLVDNKRNQPKHSWNFY